MIAAIYARKSTEQIGIADEAKSVTRQIEQARRYAACKGWVVADECVFIDDGISGAEFAGRPGFVRLLASLKPKRAFDVLIMSEESRLGREQIEVSYALKQLITAGVRVFCYLTDTERTLNSPIEKAMLALQTMADEMEREKARQRSYDAALQKARRGHVTGGGVFGYDNVPVDGHKERRINESEAVVVRQIFERCARAEGIVTIAKELNEAGKIAPRSQQGRPRAWAPSSVREVLHRELYQGVIVWNRTQKRNPWGQARRTVKPAEAWIRVDAPQLRIVDEELWRAAQARLEDARKTYLRGTNGRLWGRPGEGVESKYLLTGLIRCAVCGGSIYVKSRSHGRRRAFFYGCSSYHLRGRSVCSNGIEVPMDRTNHLLLNAFQSDILRPEHVERVIRGVVTSLRPSVEDRDARRQLLRGELTSVEQELERLTAAITAGGELGPLVAALKVRETRRQALKQELASLGTIDRVNFRQIEAEARRRLTEWRELLQTDVVQKSRQMLKKLLEEPLQARPVDEKGVRGWELTGRGSFGKLLAGLFVANTVASPTGLDRFSYELRRAIKPKAA
jgi:DNA invertase Pin-like site-specific DNA recombinase